jgi:Polyketide cyclase / dehydrase and lipid transport
MIKRAPVLLALLGALAASSGRPGTIRTLEITRSDGRYHLVANTHFDASPEAIYDVLTDYDDNAYGRISEIYKESSYLPPDRDGTPLVYTRVEGCVLFYCRSMSRVERLEADRPRFIRATTVPERSDFKYSRSEWLLEPEQGGTHLLYRLDMEPDFWLPPFVGPMLLKQTLLRGGTEAVDRIEGLAVGEG